jgi:hypothetical protein
MLIEVERVPLAFRQVVEKEASAKLAAEGFQLQSPFHLYENDLVTFSRQRQGQFERVRFSRCVYTEEDRQESGLSDEVDRAPEMPDGEKMWVSRHLFSVQIIIDSATGNLLRSGRVGTTSGEVWWDFESEDGLRLLLSEKVLPLLLTRGMECFDDALTDRYNANGRQRVLHENVA